MMAITLIVLITLAVSHWLLQPLQPLVLWVLNLSFLGWVLLGAVLWIFAGARVLPPEE